MSVRHQIQVLGVPSYTDAKQPRIKNLLDTIKSISADLTCLPLRVPQIDTRFQEFKTQCDSFIDDCKRDCLEAEEALKAILTGNLNRLDYADYDASLNEAERFYRAGMFSDASNVAKHAVEKFSLLPKGTPIRG